MAKAKTKSKRRKGKQAKLSKGKKKGGAKKRVAAKRKGAKKKKAAKRKAAPKPRFSSAPVPAAYTEISPEEITPSVPETAEEPMMGSTESMETGGSGFTSSDDSDNM